jgi:hypothetical protein
MPCYSPEINRDDQLFLDQLEHEYLLLFYATGKIDKFPDILEEKQIPLIDFKDINKNFLYGDLDPQIKKELMSAHEKITPLLCEICKENPDLPYNARDPLSRKLADWWEDHQEFDKRKDA